MPTKKYKGAEESEKLLSAIHKMRASRMRQILASVSEGPGTMRFRYGYGPFWNRTRQDLFPPGENFP